MPLNTLLLFAFSLSAAAVEPSQLERGRSALLGMAGCYLVDYSYTETESLKPGYERDKRVYDVNNGKSVKEWIYADELGPRRLRLQHVMFATDAKGQLIQGSELKHTGEDWEFEARFLFDFLSPAHWAARALPAGDGKWTRRVTNLDDGLRYQCAAAWSLDTGYPEWSCSGYAPIPGRETRDMGRKDYQALERSTRIVAYTNSWLERQANVKTIQDAGGKTPLAKELGKNWYVRLPDSECAPALAFLAPRRAFWDLLRESWDEVLGAGSLFTEKVPAPGQPTRYGSMLEVERKFTGRDLADPASRAEAKREITILIEAFRDR
jgi:hypothetical protein